MPSAFGGNDASDLQRPSSGLQAVQYSPSQKIPLDAVIGDFKSTMNALGADEQTRSEVTAYLNVVRLQAGKDQPEVPYIKQTLRTAANSLDQFIGKALGQPSKVVKEWVDALLVQNIDYKAQLPQEHSEAHPAEQSTGTPANTNDVSHSNGVPENTTPTTETINASLKSQVKSLIEAAKTSQQSGKPEQAHQQLEDALDLLKDANRPDWEGKICRMQGRLYDQSGQWEQATQAYQQAAKHFEAASQPQKQAQSLQALASILEDHGQLEQAKAAYQQVVALDQQSGTPEQQIQSLNDLASVILRQGNGPQAAQTLQQATAILQTTPLPPGEQSDIYSNLGAAHQQAQQYDSAITAYQQSLQTAKAARDKSRYSSALQQLASLYVQNNQPDQAMATLRRLKNLETA